MTQTADITNSKWVRNSVVNSVLLNNAMRQAQPVGGSQRQKVFTATLLTLQCDLAVIL